MCNPVSWVEIDGQILVLMGSDLITSRGRGLVKYCEAHEDLCGHGAVRWYYGTEADDGTVKPLVGGADREVTDFSDPVNFPIVIAKAIKTGAFRGVFPPPRRVLRVSLDIECQSRRDAINAEFQHRRDAINAEFQLRWDAINVEFQPRWDALDAEFQLRRDAINAEFHLRWDALNAEFQHRRDALNAEFHLRWVALNAEFQPCWNALDMEMWDLISCAENRSEAWK